MRATTTDLSIRAARPDDIAAIHSVIVAADAGPGVQAPEPDSPQLVQVVATDGQIAYLAHLIGRDRARARVAVDADGHVVGFAAAVETGRATHLADLFVDPARQGQGVGRRLLAEVLGDGPGTLTTFASDDPRALPIYIRAGMSAWWPNLYLGGDPTGLPARDPREPDVVPTTLATIAGFERRWAGVDRELELDYWSTLAGGQALLATRDGSAVGVGFVRDRLSGSGRWLDHAVAAPGEDGASVLLATMRAGLHGAALGGACVPGPSGLVPMLLAAGFTIRDRDIYLASDPTVVDAAREIVNTGFL